MSSSAAAGSPPGSTRRKCARCDHSLADSTSTAVRLYSARELADLPDSVTGIALGCGNPTAITELRPGEAVLDLGSGGGIDCFLAAREVGPEGRVMRWDSKRLKSCPATM